MTKSLLMIHGIGCEGEVWHRMQPGFEAAGWTCNTPTLFPDQRARENPPASLSDLGLDDYVKSMADTARHLL